MTLYIVSPFTSNTWLQEETHNNKIGTCNDDRVRGFVYLYLSIYLSIYLPLLYYYIHLAGRFLSCV